MWFLYTVLGILAFVVIVCMFFVIALLHTRDDHPMMKKLDGVVFAHRGLHDETKPENSLPAFAAAVEHGFGIEFDLHLTRDGVLVVHHDATTKRMCGQSLKINDSTREELLKLSLPDGSKILDFKEFLALVDGKVPLLVELKNDGNNARPLVKAALEQLHAYKGDYIIESFDPRVLYALKKADPEIARGQLCQNFMKSHDAPLSIRLLLSSMVSNLWTRPDFIAYNILHHGRSLPLKLLNRAHKKICFWTVRDKETYERCVKEHQNPIFEKFIP